MTDAARIRTTLFAAASAVALSAAPALAQTNSGVGAQQPTTAGSSPTNGSTQQRVPGVAPAGEAQPAAQADAPLATNGPAQDQGIVVLGVRGAQQRAISVKRNAPQIVDSIVAEDIGKLPDTTIADSLQRVPGVQITRSAGEGAGVNIRGVPQVLTTLNGELFLTAGAPAEGSGQSTSAGALASAQPNFGDIPAGLFAGVDVIKSPTANELSGGISGILALKTRRPLDLAQGLTATASLQGQYGFSSDKGGQNYDALLSYNHDGKWGGLLAFSYTDETLENDHPSSGYQYDLITDQNAGYPSGGLDLRGDGNIGNPQFTDSNGKIVGANSSKDFIYQPVFYGLNRQLSDRQRLGINGSFQYKFNDNWTATADFAYLHFQNRDTDYETELLYHETGNEINPGSTFNPDGSFKNVTTTLGPNGFVQDHSYNGLTKSDAENVSLQLAYDNHSNLRASIRYVGGVAEQTFSSADVDSLVNQRETIYRQNAAGAVVAQPANANGLPSVTSTINFAGDHPSVNFITDVSNPANWQAQSIWANGSDLNANLNVARGDVAYDIRFGNLKTIEAGVRYGQRILKFDPFNYETPHGGTGTNNLYYYNDSLIGDANYPAVYNGPSGPQNVNLSIVPQYPFTKLPQGYVTSVTDIGPYGPIASKGLPFVNTAAMNDAKGFLNSLFGGAVAYTDPAAAYRVTEKETSGYIQADFSGGSLPIFGLPWSGNVGLRVVGTQIGIRNYATNGNEYIGSSGSYNGVLVNLGAVETEKDFIDPLPELNFAVDLTDTQKLRFAVNRAVARQDLGAIGPGFKAFYLANGTRNPSLPTDLQLFSSGSSGNPDLDPFRSTNFQASYEWYFHRSSLLSLAAFYIDVDSFNVSSSTIQPIPDGDGVVRAGGNVSTTLNGGSGSVKGIEFGYQQAFDFLPGWLSGFGAQVNYTYSDSVTDNKDDNGESLPIPDNSAHQVNGVLFYQKGPLQGRIAYNWRSEQYNQQFSAGPYNYSVFTKPVGFLDASVSYDINPHVTVFAQGTNLTNAFLDRYLSYPDLFYSQSIFEQRVFFGVRLRN